MLSACLSMNSPMTSLLLQSLYPSERLRSKLNNDIQREVRGCSGSKSSSPRTTPRLRPGCSILPDGQLWLETGWQSDVPQTVTREQGRTRHTAGVWEAVGVGSSPSSVTNAVRHQAGALPTLAWISHCAMRGGVWTLSPIILIWPSPALALGVGAGGQVSL